MNVTEKLRKIVNSISNLQYLNGISSANQDKIETDFKTEYRNKALLKKIDKLYYIINRRHEQIVFLFSILDNFQSTDSTPNEVNKNLFKLLLKLKNSFSKPLDSPFVQKQRSSSEHAGRENCDVDADKIRILNLQLDLESIRSQHEKLCSDLSNLRKRVKAKNETIKKLLTENKCVDCMQNTSTGHIESLQSRRQAILKKLHSHEAFSTKNNLQISGSNYVPSDHKVRYFQMKFFQSGCMSDALIQCQARLRDMLKLLEYKILPSTISNSPDQYQIFQKETQQQRTVELKTENTTKSSSENLQRLCIKIDNFHKHMLLEKPTPSVSVPLDLVQILKSKFDSVVFHTSENIDCWLPSKLKKSLDKLDSFLCSVESGDKLTLSLSEISSKFLSLKHSFSAVPLNIDTLKQSAVKFKDKLTTSLRQEDRRNELFLSSTGRLKSLSRDVGFLIEDDAFNDIFLSKEVGEIRSTIDNLQLAVQNSKLYKPRCYPDTLKSSIIKYSTCAPRSFIDGITQTYDIGVDCATQCTVSINSLGIQVSVKDQVCGENNTNSENDHGVQNANTKELSKLDSGVNEFSEESFEFIQKGFPFSVSSDSNIITSPKEYSEVLQGRINDLQKKDFNWCKSEGNMFSLNNSIKSNQDNVTSSQPGTPNSLNSLENLVSDQNLNNDFDHQNSITVESKEISNLNNTSYIRHDQNSVSLGESNNPILSLESEGEMPKLTSQECVHEKIIMENKSKFSFNNQLGEKDTESLLNKKTSQSNYTQTSRQSSDSFLPYASSGQFVFTDEFDHRQSDKFHQYCQTDESLYLKDKWFVQSTSVGSQTITDAPVPKIPSTGVVSSESPETIVKNSVISEDVYTNSSSRKESLKLLHSKIIELARLSQFGRQDIMCKIGEINIQSTDTLDSLLEKTTSVLEFLFECLGKNLNDVPASTKSPPCMLQGRLKVLELTLLNHELVLVIQKLLCNTIGSSFYLQTDRNVEISE
ncbi:hypothetical protein HDV04_005384 [Boothiomyces sp. JEL0838]|nr:hypothetical protein HDV04_005384 [Boothiomyces sp. JEL0838]